MEFRELRDDETDLLKEFLYEAIFLPEGTPPPPASIIMEPELALYYEGFGSGIADKCIVAEEEGRVVGAVWSRIMDDYGHVDDVTPSLAISLYKPYRSKGYGRKMMEGMLKLLREGGFERVSLAVQKDNYALRLYESCGFVKLRENDQEYIMVCDLKGEDPSDKK